MKIELNEEEVEIVREIMDTAWKAYPNNAGATFRHVRLLKNFGIIKNRELLCKMCIVEMIDRHAESCDEYKEKHSKGEYCPCDDSHYDYDSCREATWMINDKAVYNAERKAAKDLWCKNPDKVLNYNGIIRFDHNGRKKWLEETFPDIIEDVRFNPWLGLLCDEHIGSMKEYANRI